MKVLPAGLMVAALLQAGITWQPSDGPAALPARLVEPNVVLITIDTLRADHLGCYGYGRVKTPAIDALARQSVRFAKAYTPVPLTLPAHTALMTGSYPMTTGMHDFIRNKVPVNAVTLARILHDHGYRTAAFVSAIVLDSRFGLNAGFDSYFDHFDTARADATDQAAIKRNGDETVDLALSWLREHAGSAATPSPQPFFIWVHLFDPHRPYNPPEPYATRYRTDPYDGEIAFDDAQVGRLEAELQERGLWNDALVVLTADHGEGLGEHGEEGHGFFIYNSTLHVPLLIHIPQASPRVVNSGVSLVDVMPTVLQALRIAVPPSVQGRSVLQLALGHVSNSDSILYSESYLPLLHFGWSALRGLQAHGLKYIDAPRPEIYAVDADPDELRNLYGIRLASADELHRELFSDLRRLTPQTAMATVEEGPADPALLEHLRALGYVDALPRLDRETGTPSLADPKDRIQVYQSYLRAASDSEDGRYDASLAELRRAAKSDPTSPFIACLQGLDRYRLKEYQRAKEKFRTALNLDPSFTLAHYYLGRTQFQLAELDQAISSLQDALAEDRANFAAAYHLGEAYVKKGRMSDGVRSFRQAIGLRPDYAPAYQALGEAYLEQKQPGAAAGVLEHALQIESGSVKVHYDLGRAYRALGRSVDAEREFRFAKSQ